MTGMLDRVLGQLGAAPVKKRQSAGGTPARGGALQEALRARGGTNTTNLKEVISHKEAQSDTEAFAPPVRRAARESLPARPQRPARESLPATLPDALRAPPRRSASTDDDIGVERSRETNLGWLDLQAFAPRALQKQLERLQNAMEANLLEGDQSSQGGDGVVGGGITPRGESAGKSSASSSGGLRAALQSRGGAFQRREAGYESEPEPGKVLSRTEKEADVWDVEAPARSEEPAVVLTSVPEDEEMASSSPTLADLSPPSLLPADSLALESLTLEEPAIESTDVSASDHLQSPPKSPTEVGTADPPSDTTTCESSSAERGDNSPAENEASELGVEIPLAEASELTAEPALPVAKPLEVVEGDVEAKALEVATETQPVLVSAATAQAEQEVRHFVPTLQLPRSPNSAGTTEPSQAATLAAKLRPSLLEESAAYIVESAPQAQAKVPGKLPVASWCPGPSYDGPRKDSKTEVPVEAEVKVEKKKFKDAREFWGKHSIAFAGPSLGARGISKGEAQAALQRLVSNGAACDPSEVRRLKKLIDM